MKRHKYCLITVLVTLSMLLGLTSCGKDTEKKPEKLAFQAAPYYTGEDIPAPVTAGALDGCCTDGASVWFLSRPGENQAPVLCRVPLDGGEAETLAEYQPPEGDEDTYLGFVGPVLGGDGKLWVWAQRIASGYDLPEDFDPETDIKGNYFTGTTETFQMCQLDPETGKELKTVDITAAMGELKAMFFNGMAVDGNGTIYLSDQKRVLAVDGQGQVLFSLKASLAGGLLIGGAGGTLAVTPEGAVAALTSQPGDKIEVRSIDFEAKDWGTERYAIQPGVTELYHGSGECLFYFIKSDVIYGMIPGEELPQRLLSWGDVRLESPSSVRCFALQEEGQAAIFTSVHAPGTDVYEDRLQVTKLLPTEDAPQDDRVKLVYGMIGDNIFARQRVKLFNGKSKEYYIEVRDYAEGMLGDQETDGPYYQGAITRLYAEIAQGKTPDILDETIPLEALAKQGVLEDLWPWIDQDPDISRDTVMSHVLECAEVNGKLPRICGGFAIETAVAGAEVAGDRTGWTMEEMQAAYGGQMPELYFGGTWDSRLVQATFNRFDQKSTLYNLVRMNLDYYVNWETGECFFDGEDFKALLTMSGNAKAIENGVDLEDPTERWQRGTASLEADAAEPCRLFPWGGGPILYSRTLAAPRDLVIDDVLFGGRETLTDFEQRLWDADILHTWVAPATGIEITSPRSWNSLDCAYSAISSATSDYVSSEDEPIAADCVTGGADGNVYASFVGLPAESGTGSSFSLFDSMAIAAASEAKEGAWAFIRTLLLPEGNTVRWDEAYQLPSVNGFAMNRETLETQLECTYWLNTETGEYFLDKNGERVEYSEHALAAGNPGDIILMAYLFAPSETQLERFWNLYNAIDHLTGEDSELLDIILEQAQPYFAGDKTLEETVKLIQNRAQLYVNENR